MPVTDTIKPTDGTRKRTTDSINSLSKKRSGRLKEPAMENGSRGDDVSPSRWAGNKKPPAKKTASDNNAEKKAKTLISDKVPKKSVQRAKGSLALNKTIESEEKKKRLFDLEESNNNSTTTIKDSIDGTKAAKPDRCKPVKTPVKNPANERRVPSSKKKNWATVVKKKSGSTLKGEEEEDQQQAQQQQEGQPAEMVPRETKSAEIQPEGAPFSSCSFFEKLQQGVKAYFSSRNSLTEEKPNKKKVTEGGIRTGAGVAKGGKEETKARTRENKISNKIKNLDSDLFYDRPRLKSNSGGQMNNFLNKKPKVLHYVRHKKLYHPKKHYERIQIPRKGYFYRLFEFRPSPSATDPVNRRVEPVSLPTKSEIQIARMASSSPKVSDIYKKRMKKLRKRTPDMSHINDELAMVSNYLEAVNFILNQRKVAQKFEKEVNRIALDWPTEDFVPPENISFLWDEKKSISSESLSFEEDENPSEASKNSPNATNIQKLDHGLEIESQESYSILESQRSKSALDCELPEISDRNSDESYDVLINCLKDSLGDEQRCDALGISPVLMTPGDSETNPIRETQPKIESNKALASVRDFDWNFPNSLKENDCMATALFKYKIKQPIKTKPKEQFAGLFAELLLGDIDLHSELQNYLRETKFRKANDTENTSIISKNDPSFGLDAEECPKEDFESALGVDADLVQVPVNPSSEIDSPPEETVRLETEEDLDSNAKTEASKTELEIDLKKHPQEDRDSVTSSDKKDILVTNLVNLLFKKYNEQLGNALDRYEKVSPMKAVFRAKRQKTNLLSSNLVRPLPKDELASNIAKTNSEPNEFQTNEGAEPERKIKAMEDAAISQSLSSKKWCLTFEELEDIYSCLTKLSSKWTDFQQLENIRYSSVMSILKDKPHDPQSNADLVKFLNSLKEYFTPPSSWNFGADANKHKKLQEYVSMFQEILMSSLSIEQITYLNNVISQVQEQETSTEFCVKTNPKGSKKSILKVKTKSENETSKPPAVLSVGKTKEQELKSAKNTPAKIGSTKDAKAIQNKCNLKGKSELKKIQPVVESPQKVQFSPPAELEKVLKSTFNSENLTKTTRAMDKILVNVKVCGSRVLVNDFSYIHDEKSLSARPPIRNKVSELIIEKITSDISCKASLSCTSLAPPASKKSSKKSVKKPRNIKIVLKSIKSGGQKSGNKLKIGKGNPKIKNEKPEEKHVNKITTLKAAEECKNVKPVETLLPDASVPLRERKNAFEYDQERLKAQHPIDAIIETSESKIMETIESTENIDHGEQLSVENKNSKKLEATELQEASNKAKTDRPFLKDLINDLGWSNDDNRKDLIRTKSYNLNTNRDENFVLSESSTNDVKFLDDSQLKRGTVGKKNRKIPMRQQNTYFCYPSVVCTDKSTEGKKKTSTEANLVGVKKMNSKTVKKTDSRVVKTAKVKGTKEEDSKVMKANSKTMKKTDPRVMKMVNSEIVKQTDLKVMKTISAKPVQKKNFKESSKRHDAMSTFSRQIATSERLAKKPDRFAKSISISPEQKENFSISEKSRVITTLKTDSAKNSENSILYMKGTTDFGSEASSINASTASSYFEEVLQKQKPHSENSAQSTSSSETADITEKCKTSPIVIFSTLDDSDGVTSQFAMIHSDSVLKTLSRSPISPTKIETVFKSHSDLKFYPGRISDSMEEQRPWVKFVLTPQQEANADLPAHQIKVVDKHHQEQKDPTEQAEDSENNEIPLESIEKFIDELRNIRLKAQRQKALEKRKNKERKASSSEMIKPKIKWSHGDLSKTVAVNKQVCRKNKSTFSFLELRGRGGKKNSGKEAILAKVIVSILQFLLQKKVKETENAEQADKNSESKNVPSDSADGMSDAEEAVEKWHKLEKTTSVMLSEVVNGVTKFEKLLHKKKFIVALKAELEKREAKLEANVETLLQLSKKLASLKSLGKTENEADDGTDNNETEKEIEEEEVTSTIPSEEIKVEEFQSSKENDVEDLGQNPSTFFDAEETVKGENEGHSKQLQGQSGETFADAMLALLGESTMEIKCSEEAYPTVSLTRSDESLFSKKSIDSDTEEIIFRKIHESLEENDVHYSMALFDSLLKKKGILDRDEKLQSLLQAVNQKTKTMMRDLEKNAWMKLLFLLEEVSRIYDMQEEKSGTESSYRFITNNLNKPLAFIGRIQLIKTKVTNLQNFLSQSRTCLSDYHLPNFISGFLTRLLHMKNSIIPRLTSSVMRFFEDEATGNSLGYKIRAVKTAHNFHSTSEIPEKKSQIQFLKNQIKDQRLFIEYLINADSGSSSSEITDVKNRVSEKLKSLEKSLLHMTNEEDGNNVSRESLLESVANSVSLSQISSLLGLTRTCRSTGIAKPNTWNVEACK